MTNYKNLFGNYFIVGLRTFQHPLYFFSHDFKFKSDEEIQNILFDDKTIFEMNKTVLRYINTNIKGYSQRQQHTKAEKHKYID